MDKTDLMAIVAIVIIVLAAIVMRDGDNDE